MAVHLFILGLPGSGKSTISRYIVDYVQKQHRSWSTSRLNDYAILHEMFLADFKHEKFTPTKGHDGFDILDLSQFDIALKEMEKRAKEVIHASDKTELILMEFARVDYRHAFVQFRPDIVQSAYLLFLDVDIDICKQRIRDRVANPQNEDDHYVSEYIFESYYDKNSSQHLFSNLNTNSDFAEQKIRFIDNNGQFEDILSKINEFIDFIFEQESDKMVASGS